MILDTKPHNITTAQIPVVWDRVPLDSRDGHGSRQPCGLAVQGLHGYGQGAPWVSSILDTRKCEYWFRGATSTRVLVGPYMVGSVQMFRHFLANWRLVLVVYGCLLACRVSSVVPVAVIPPLMSHKLDISAAIDTPTCSSGKYLRVLSIHILMSTHALTSTRKSDTRTSASINFPRTTSTRIHECILMVHLAARDHRNR